MTENKKSLVPGLILIVVGAFLLLRRLDLFYLSWYHVYPLIMIGLSAALFFPVFRKNERSSIFPGTVLLVLGVFFLFRNYDLFSFDYFFYDAGDYWPIFLIAFGAAFVVQFLFSPDDWGVLIPGTILLILGSVFILERAGVFYWFDFVQFWPLILIAVGVSLVIASFRKKSQQDAMKKA